LGFLGRFVCVVRAKGDESLVDQDAVGRLGAQKVVRRSARIIEASETSPYLTAKSAVEFLAAFNGFFHPL